MRKFLIIARELKDWLEYFIRNTPGRIGYLLRANYYKSTLKNLSNKFDLSLD